MSSSKDAHSTRHHQSPSSSGRTTSNSAANHNPTAEHTRQFTHNGRKLPFFSGKVSGECGKHPFVQPTQGIYNSLSEVYPQQPALVQPRLDWSHWNKDHPIRLSVDDEERDIIQKVKDVKFPYYKSVGIKASWGLHCVDLWECFNSIEAGEWIGSTGLHHLLSTAMNGLDNIVLAAPAQLEIHGTEIKSNNDWGHKKTPFLPDEYDKVDCTVHMGWTSPLQFRQAMDDKSFLVGFIHHTTPEMWHWTAFSFDLKKGKLYHFDTVLYDQMERLNRVVLAVREFLANHGLTFDYDFHQMPISQQYENWECGICSLYALVQFHRRLRGISEDQAKSVHGSKGLFIDGRATAPAQPSDHLFCDWIPHLNEESTSYDTKKKNEFLFIKGFWKQVILMELGILDAKYYQVSKDGKLELGTYDEAKHVSFRPLMGHPGPIDIGELYTSEGGYPVIWSAARGYEKNCNRDRLLSIPKMARSTYLDHTASP
ncbi:hypothetical protein ACHAPJ_013596, partial [Fusarium lateritium]